MFRHAMLTCGLLVTSLCAVRGEETVSDAYSAALKKLPSEEKPITLFNGKDLTGFEGNEKYWKVENGCIVGSNTEGVTSSTYLFTKESYREFRLLLEVKQTLSPKHSTMHSAVAALGEVFTDAGENRFGFKGPLLMFCHDWGIWDAHRRNRIAPVGAGPKVEKKGEWNLLEFWAKGDRIQCVANGTLVFDFTDKPDMLKKSPLGLQLHSNGKPQEFHFRGLTLTTNPQDMLVTLPEKQP
jgi:Domain of Unknown Function (DUF1080)